MSFLYRPRPHNYSEFLHNYDAEDSYGQTEYEGMAWGLDGVQLSATHGSAFVKEGSGIISSILNNIINALKDNDVFKYDFYLERDNPHSDSYVNPSRNGYNFCTNIIQAVNGYIGDDKDTSNDIDILNLGEDPRSAVEYCFNKNKRNSNGQVIWQNADGSYNQTEYNWYLPAIDEIEEIVMSEYGQGQKTYSRFLDFQGKYYWSSMPAYERNYIDYNISFHSTDGEFYVDDLDRARATKVVYVNSNYDNVDSGVVEKNENNETNYTNTLYIRRLRGLRPNITMEPTTQRDQEGLYYEGEDPSFYEDGNDSRSQKNRIRCVRKQ